MADPRDPEIAFPPRLRLCGLHCVVPDRRPDVLPEDGWATDAEMDVNVRAEVLPDVDHGREAPIFGCAGCNRRILYVLGPDAEDHALADKRSKRFRRSEERRVGKEWRCRWSWYR